MTLWPPTLQGLETPAEAPHRTRAVEPSQKPRAGEPNLPTCLWAGEPSLPTSLKAGAGEPNLPTCL